jgi:hexulose-6-phosphate isomerase
MKNGASFYSFPQDCDLRYSMQTMKDAGYHGVELVLGSAGDITMNTPDVKIKEIAAMARDIGVEVCTIGTWLLWEYNFVSEDAKERDYTRDTIKKQLDIAAICGADTVLVVPGYCGTEFAPNQPLVRYDHAYGRAQESLGMLADYAKERKVSIGIENVWNRFLLSPVEVARFLDEIGSNYVGAYFDVGNIIYIGYPQHWIEILGKRIKKIHICDYRASQAGLGAFVDALAGDVDFAEVMKSLRSIGYDDYLTYEMLPNYPKFPYQSMIYGSLSLDKILTL